MTFSFKIRQQRKPATRADYDRHPAWIVVYNQAMTRREIRQQSWLELLVKRRKKLSPSTTDSDPFTTELPNSSGAYVVYACLDDSLTGFKLLTLARKLITCHDKRHARNIMISVPGYPASKSKKRNTHHLPG